MKRKRPKPPVIGTCRLCIKEGQVLKESHIISKFHFQECRGPEGNFRLMTSDGQAKIQDGYKEHLLCEACEQKRSKWESYARQVILGPHGTNAVRQNHLDRAWMVEMDYQKFKLYAMSLLWMMATTSLEHFQTFSLTAEELEGLRRAIDACDPLGPNDFPFTLTTVGMGGRSMITCILPPQMAVADGDRFCCVIVNGVLIQFVLNWTGHPQITEFYLRPAGGTGKQLLLIRDISEIQWLDDYFGNGTEAWRATMNHKLHSSVLRKTGKNRAQSPLAHKNARPSTDGV